MVKEFSSPDDFTTCVPLEKGGSGRQFFRVTRPDGSPAILCRYDNSREENALYAPLAKFLAQLDFPVPKIFSATHNADDGTGALVMEDAGETDLWSLRGDAWMTRKTAYESALRALHKLHHHDHAAWLASDGDVQLMPAFDDALYAWERNYFLENAVTRHLRIALASDAAVALENELAALAARLVTLPPQLVHRDCQSQNILWSDGAARFIDFQGMRVGTGFYDLGSLLWDPYVAFAPEERAALLDFYWNLGGHTMTRENFDAAFRDAAAQRLMQALGAFGFLGIVKGRKDFLAHFSPALENLFLVTRENPSLPRLHQLVEMMRKKTQSLS